MKGTHLQTPIQINNPLILSNITKNTRSQKIKLNIGGKIFTTLKSNLMKHKGSYFHAMLSNNNFLPDEEGAYFIDMCSVNFHRIMDYLRNDHFNLKGLSKYEVDILKLNIDYLQLPCFDTLNQLLWRTDCGNKTTVKNGGRTILKTGLSGWNSSTLGSIVAERYCIKIEAADNFSFFMVGFVPKDLHHYKADGNNYRCCGWYLYGNGTLYSADGDNGRPYGKKLSTGTILVAIHDKNKGEIRFEMDTESCGVAFENIKTEELIPSIEIHSTNVQISLFDN